MADLAKLVVRLEAQSSQLLTELEKANSKIDRFASATNRTLTKWAGGLTAAFSARAIFNFVADVQHANADLADMAQKSGVSTETLTGLGYAAKQAGADLGAIDTGLKGLANSASEAAKGSNAAAAAYKALGIKVTDSNGNLKTADALLFEIADKYNQYADGLGKSANAQDLLGKTGRELIPFLNQGSEAIRGVIAEGEQLGAVIGTDAAKAADDFADNLDKLTIAARGAVSQGLAEVTPLLKSITDEMVNMLTEGDGVQRFAAQITTGFKLIIDIGYSVYKTFDDIGTALGALAAAAVQVAKGNFSEAGEIMRQANADQIESEKKANEFLEKLWSDTGKNIVESAKNTDKELKKTLSVGGNKALLDEIEITATPVSVDAVQKYYDDLNEATRTSSERALVAYYDQTYAVQELFDQGKIGATTYNERLKAINASLDEATGVTERQNQALQRSQALAAEGKSVWEATRTPLEKYNAELVRFNLLLEKGGIDQETYNRAVTQSQKAFEDATNGANKFYEEATRNAQDILGDGIYDAIKNGFDGAGADVLQSFGDLLLKLGVQALAAQIGAKIFGSGGVGSDGGWIGAIAAAIGGGGRAMGGAVNAGVSYRVNETDQERFVPLVPGRIEKADSGWGGQTIINNFHITAPKGTVSRQTEQQVATAAAGSLAIAQRRNG